MANIFQQGMDAFDNAYARTGQMRQDIARTRAGRKLANRDYQGAATDLGNAGMLEAATGVQNYGQAQGDRQAAINAATAYGNGDTEGAIQALGQTGDLKTIAAVQDQARQQHLAQLQTISQEASKLQNVLKAQGPDAMLAAFDSQVPTYKAMGSSDQELGQLRQALATHPEAVLSALAQPKHSFHTVGDTLFVADDNTGQVLGRYDGAGAGFKAMQLDETRRHNRATEGVASGNLGMRQKEFKARQAAGGFGTPGAGVVAPKGAWEEF
jgi:hypothetical protein